MRFRDLGLKLKIMGGGLVPIILAAILFVVVLFSLQSMLKTVLWQDHTHRILRQIVEIEADTMGVVAWVRGYLLSGDEKFVEGLKREEASLERGFQQLKKLGADNQELIQAVSNSRAILDNVMAGTKPAIELRREIANGKSMNDLQALILATGDTGFGRFRDLTKALTESQQSVVDRFKNDAARDPQHTAGTVDQYQAHMALKQAFEIFTEGLEMGLAERGFLLTGKNELLDGYDAAAKRVFALLEKQKQTVVTNPGQAKLVQEIEDTLKAWRKDIAEPEIALRKQIATSKTMNEIQALVAGSDRMGQIEKFEEVLGDFKEVQENVLKEREQLSKRATEGTQTILVVGIALMILASFFISYFLAKAISRPVTQAVDLAVGISKGDLSQTLEKRGEDEVGSLIVALNQMVEFLREQARRTIEGVNVLGSSAAEISATVSQLAMSTSKTSAAVTETTTTVEQVKQAARVSSDKAKKVAEASQQAVQISDTGKKATEETMLRIGLIKEQMESIGETVVRLSEHSQAIEDIISSVQDLADQSNLLAVNASIEAARAGDQGKGFAVVAHEIKTLADQSKTSTDQVRSILEDTRKWVSAVVMATEQGNKAVEAGVAQSAMAGESIQALTSSVGASSQAAAVIHSSTEQQFVGVDQVSTAMLNIQQAMQQNVAGTAQLEAAAKRIEEIGVSLKDLMSRYRILEVSKP